jgi:hypothetical protein
VVAVALLAAGCGSQSADERLNLKLDELKVSLEAHSTNRVMDILHQDFQANAGLNCDWTGLGAAQHDTDVSASGW